MPRPFRLSIALLPFALCAATAAAQDAGSPPAAAPQAGPRMVPPAQREQARPEQARPMPQRPAVDPAQRGERFSPPAQPDRRSISNAVRQVRRSTGGQIVGAEQVPYEGRNITRVKYMDDRGRVRYMDMDESGAAERRTSRRTDNGQP